ncbi:anthranilate synthase component I family protein [Alicyclobacillus cycloheptanicus]|uniref:Anthranilate synthase component 1 n=1 Tax=Alicyclobacillus cycloheptanicus TaxID=1457 RepID=A0ABT9XHS0_9BACL|nr:anthranilate synthase component I family protein [Alicyclobacillus cycloheptanicus]MDQ0189574.1 anthranilate synthase component 1 [Alicyclobacillus cycloheptanicus]WDM01627.1 anthranilate synthase component I family protein [Alicyclobacillus cycloheptanicus]
MTQTVHVPESGTVKPRPVVYQRGGVDAFYTFLDLVDGLGEGRVFLLEAASEEGRPEYQMSLVGIAPVLEVQVKDGRIHLFAVDGLRTWLTERLAEAGYEAADRGTEVVEAVGSTKVAEDAEAAATHREPRPSVVDTRPLVYGATDPMAWLEALRTAVMTLLPAHAGISFSQGLLGYIGYDAVHYLEALPKTTVDDRGLPDIRLQWHAGIVQITSADTLVFDSVAALATVVSEEVARRLSEELAYAKRVIASAEQGQTRGQEKLLALAHLASGASVRADRLWEDDVTQAKFEANVRQAKDYIRAGDIFQVVLSKRMRVQKVFHPYVAYDRLRKLNPSPYMFVAEYPDMRVFGASPEVQFRSVNGWAEMKPIAGTSKGRGKTPEEDRALADRLLHDEKERAEHVMLVDLCRNDLGRVCQIGSIEVPELMSVEPYSHLFHLVSVVRGRLRPDVSVFHALLATFPAGTLSGAPKIRAMEIIDELEDLRRGPYGGMIGMIDFAGNANTAIVIRTVVETNETYFVQVGAGIVADSDPAQEWLECGHKAGATIEVLTGHGSK